MTEWTHIKPQNHTLTIFFNYNLIPSVHATITADWEWWCNDGEVFPGIINIMSPTGTNTGNTGTCVGWERSALRKKCISETFSALGNRKILQNLRKWGACPLLPSLLIVAHMPRVAEWWQNPWFEVASKQSLGYFKSRKFNSSMFWKVAWKTPEVGATSTASSLYTTMCMGAFQRSWGQ